MRADWQLLFSLSLGGAAYGRNTAPRALRRLHKEPELVRVPIHAKAQTSLSLADHKYRFIADFEVVLKDPIYQGWNITLVFDQSIPWISSLESELIDWSAENKTLTFGPLFWNHDLHKGYQTQNWQGITTALETSIVDSYITYDASVKHPSPQDTRPVHQEACPIELHEPVKEEKYNLAKSLQLSILFYEVQRSGKMPPSKRIPWRYDSELEDRGSDGEDLTGGWHDAGDHIKFGWPLGSTCSTLLWGLILFKEGYAAAGELDNALDSVKWGLDWILKAHVKPDELYVQVSDKPTDHFVWTRPEDMTAKRKAYKVTCDNPGSQPVLESAAALAAASVVYRDHRHTYPHYADTVLEHAKQLFDFAVRCPGDYVSDGHVPAECCYGAGKWDDNEAWAAAWLYVATGKAHYMEHAERVWQSCCSLASGKATPMFSFSWRDKYPGVNLLLYNITRKAQYAEAVKNHLDGWVDGSVIPKTPKGLSFMDKWGSIRTASNTALMALAAAEYGLQPKRYRDYAKSQIYYALGDCCNVDMEEGHVQGGDSTYGPGLVGEEAYATTTAETRLVESTPVSTNHNNDTTRVSTNSKGHRRTWSYQMGFADDGPSSPHHRATSCNLQGHCECSNHPSYHVLYGAIVGGPMENDFWYDKCPDFVKNEVAIDYNAGFQGAVAGLKTLSVRGQLDDA